MPHSKPESSDSEQILSSTGLRPTRQRRVVYEVLRRETDHPTAEQVHERARSLMPGISLATVYNCLDSFVAKGLVRQINFQRQSSRYCAVDDENPHFAHFHCRKSGAVYDIVLSDRVREMIEAELPKGLRAEKFEVNLAGVADGIDAEPHTPLSKHHTS